MMGYKDKRLRDYVKKHWLLMTGGIFMKVCATVAELFTPWILAYIIDTIVPTKSIGRIVWFAALMLFCTILGLVFNVWGNRTAALVAKRTTYNLRNDLFARISYLSCRQMDEFSMPSVITRLTSNTYDVNNMIGFMLRMGIRSPILMLGGIAMTFFLDPVLTLVMIGIIPFIILAVYIITKRSVPMYSQSYKMADKVTQVVRENIAGIRVIKALSKTDYEKQRFEKNNIELSSKEKKVAGIMAASNPLMNLFFNLGLVGIVLVAAFRVNNGQTKLGVVTAFLTYFVLVLNGIIAITRIFVLYSKALASSKRIFEVINTKEEIVLHPCDKLETDNHIEFSDVNFSYFKQRDNIKNVSFQLMRGQTLGIIGGVGSGKTTLINLLMRFYDVDSGTVRINGENIKGISPKRLYKMFGVAFQNDILFADTIERNIDFYQGAQREDILDAIVAAQASEFIQNYADGIEKKIAIKGADLSGGQKQRLLISRAFSKSADIIILDDSSSALDFKTDALLRRQIKEKYKNATKIIVAQRISSIKDADLILVLDDGAVVGKGNHNSLMHCCKQYQEIYNIQSGE